MSKIEIQGKIINNSRISFNLRGLTNLWYKNLYLDITLLSYVLPTSLLTYFKITRVSELCSIKDHKDFIEVHLEENNQLPSGYSSVDYESKGFVSSKRVQDFPLRGKAVYLVIKRRRWRNKLTKEEIRSDYSFIAEGSKLTQELSDFLKDTGRYPRRYH